MFAVMYYSYFSNWANQLKLVSVRLMQWIIEVVCFDFDKQNIIVIR